MSFSKFLLIATVIAAPSFASAMSCGDDNTAAVHCLSGTVWDHDSNRCIPKVAG